MLHLDKILLLLFLCCFGMCSIEAQICSLTLKGIVQDEHQDERLEFANVYIEELQNNVVCDKNGMFQFDSICIGEFHFIVSHLGCESKRFFIDIQGDTSLTFLLEHHSNMLNEVVVKEQIGKAGAGLNHYVISGNTLQAMAGKDIAQIAGLIPGVQILKSGGALNKPIINGLFSNRIQILNQGIPQEGQQWGNDHAPEIDAFTSQKLSVIKGSAAVKYGVNAMAGVLILQSIPVKNDPHIHGHFLNLYNSNGHGIINNLTFEQQKKHFRYRVIATSKNLGDSKTPNYFLTNTGSNEKNIAALFTNSNSAKWSKSLYVSTFNSNIGILRGAHIGNVTDLKEAINRKQPFFTNPSFSYKINAPRQAVNHHLIKFENKYLLSEKAFLSLDVAQQWNLRKEYDIRRNNRDSIPSLNLRLMSNWIQVAYLKEWSNFQLETGFQNKLVSNRNVEGTGILPLLPNYTLFYPSYFISSFLKVNKNTFESGIRYEYQRLAVATIDLLSTVRQIKTNYTNLAANIGFHREITDHFIFKSNIALVKRGPQVHELFSNGLHQGLASIEEGNENLNPETSIKWNMDLKFNIMQENQLTISPFYHYVKDYIFLAPTTDLRLTIRGAFPLFKYRQTDAVIKGIDLMYNQSIHHAFDVNVKMSFTQGIDKATEQGLIYIPPFNGGLGMSYTKNKIGKFDDIKLSTEYNFMSRQTIASSDQDLLPAPDAYSLFNAGISVRQKLKKIELLYSLQAENIFNKTYRNYLNRLRYFSDDLGRNILFKIQLIF
jgi:iron complex outermembrane recepter protein